MSWLLSSLYRKTLVSCVHCLHYFECNLPTDDKLYTRSYWCDRQRSDISRRNQRTEGCKAKRSMLSKMIISVIGKYCVMHDKFMFCFGVVLYGVLCCRVLIYFSALSVYLSPSSCPPPSLSQSLSLFIQHSHIERYFSN